MNIETVKYKLPLNKGQGCGRRPAVKSPHILHLAHCCDGPASPLPIPDLISTAICFRFLVEDEIQTQSDLQNSQGEAEPSTRVSARLTRWDPDPKAPTHSCQPPALTHKGNGLTTSPL